MKILLIQPPFTIFRSESKKCHPSLELAYLAGALKGEHEVLVLDALAEGYDNECVIGKGYLRYGLSLDDIRKKITKLEPDVVGISCLFSSQSGNVHSICEAIKEIDKKIITIIGGAHPSAMPKEVLKDTNVDFVVIGEGETALRQLLKNLQDTKDMEEVDGIGFRHNGLIKVNERKNYEMDLDGISFPYWDIFPLEKYSKINNPHGNNPKRTPFLPMITSRGCPFDCTFCSVHNLWGKNYRVRSPENVLTEIEYLINKFGIKEILFEDDNLTLEKGRSKAIFEGMINRKFDITWTAPNGVAAQTLSDETLELMKKSGCYSISLGVESGDEYLLKHVIKKPVILPKIKPLIDKAKKLKLDTVVFFVVGLPGETRESLRKTFSFAESLGVDNVNFFFATPLPGTRLWELCKKENLININDTADFLNLKSEYPNFATTEFSKDSLMFAIFYERLKLLFLLLFKNPRRFLSKLYNKLLNDMNYFARFTRIWTKNKC